MRLHITNIDQPKNLPPGKFDIGFSVSNDINDEGGKLDYQKLSKILIEVAEMLSAPSIEENSLL